MSQAAIEHQYGCQTIEPVKEPAMATAVKTKPAKATTTTPATTTAKPARAPRKTASAAPAAIAKRFGTDGEAAAAIALAAGADDLDETPLTIEEEAAVAAEAAAIKAAAAPKKAAALVLVEWDGPNPAEFKEWRLRLGVGREVLARVAGIVGSRAWAIEHPAKEVSVEHKTAYLAALKRIEAEGLPEGVSTSRVGRPAGKKTVGPTKDELAQRIKAASALIGEARAQKTIAAMKAVIEQLDAILHGATATEPEED